ncbi:MAG: MerR family transcriptional regulator [Bacillota bacterium]|nr:MerR family transcriptional regulator [Bacillota bacterium]
MLKIGEFSKMAGVTPRMLKYYEETGLLLPRHIDVSNGYRYYEAGQLLALAQIKMLQSVGFSTREMSGVIGAEISSELLAEKKQQILDNMQGELEKVRLLEFYENALSSLPFNQDYTAVIKELPAVTVVAARRVLGNVDEVEAYIFFVLREAEARGYHMVTPVYGTVTYFDEEYRDENIDCEITFPVERLGRKTSLFVVKETEYAEQAVCVLHKGGYHFLKDAYIFAYDWIDKNGYQAAAPVREKYLSGMWDMAEKEGDYLTELQIPIRKRG